MRLSFPLAVGLLALVLVGSGCSGSDTVPTTAGSVVPATTAPAAKAIEASPMDEKEKLTFPGVLSAEEIQSKSVRIHTEKGDIVIELFPDTAPKTVSNFVYLAERGFYDGLTFHRYVPGFVIQGGDPTGTGTSGPGYKFEDELNDSYGYDRGIVAMANSGPNTNGSQFFIMLKDTPVSDRGMQKLYTVFGRVTEGMDVVDELRAKDIMTTVTIEDKK